MFERFTDRARRAVMLAEEEARLLNHNYIGTEHVLLGLIHEGRGVAAKALVSLGISFEAARHQVEEILGRGESSPSGRIPYTSRAKKVLEVSLREALQLGHNYIGTEHILLGLIREGEGVAAQVLVKLGADLSQVRERVMQILSGQLTWEKSSPPTASMTSVGNVGILAFSATRPNKTTVSITVRADFDSLDEETRATLLQMCELVKQLDVKDAIDEAGS